MPAVERSTRSPGSTRAMPRVLLGLAVLLLVARVATGLHEREHPSVPRSLVSWVAPEEAESLARERGLPIFYNFTASWCAPCHAMDRDVFHKEEIAQGINQRFIPVRVKARDPGDGEDSVTVQALLKKHGVVGFPTLIIVPPAGGEVRENFGYEGYTHTVRFLGLVH